MINQFQISDLFDGDDKINNDNLYFKLFDNLLLSAKSNPNLLKFMLDSDNIDNKQSLYTNGSNLYFKLFNYLYI